MRWLLGSLLCCTCVWASPTPPVERTAMSGPDRFEITARLPIQVEKLLPILERPCHVERWMPELEEIRILGRPGPGETLVYMATTAPWPVGDRDAVTLFEHKPGPPVVLTMRGMPDAYPRRDGYVRLPYTQGEWRLWPSGDGTLIRYRQRVEAGGKMPQWLADQWFPQRITATLKALKAYVTQSNRPDCSPGQPSP